MADEIRYLKRHEIDTAKWNDLVDASPDGTIYGHSWMLDAATDNWNALILGDYKIILPLPIRKKWGLSYVYQPAFLQYIPMMGVAALTQETIDLFFEKLSSHFKWVKACFNVRPDTFVATRIKTRTNFILPIPDHTSELLYRKKKDIIKNLRKASGCMLVTDITIQTIISYYDEAYGKKFLPNRTKDLIVLDKILNAASTHHACHLYGVTDVSDNLIFAGALLHCKQRLIYIAGAPTEIGRAKSATHFFIDKILTTTIGNNLLFDFEGSDISSVAAFYQKFMPATEYYYQIQMNRIPLISRIV